MKFGNWRVCWSTPVGTVHHGLAIWTEREVKAQLKVLKKELPENKWWAELINPETGEIEEKL